MSSLSEIEVFQSRIARAQLKETEDFNAKFGFMDTIPNGFYNNQQLSRFQQVEGLLAATTEGFMSNLGLRYQLRERFNKRGNRFFGYVRHMHFLMSIGEDLNTIPQYDSTIGLEYEPMRKGNDDTLEISYQPLLVPQDYGEIKGNVLEPISALLLMTAAGEEGVSKWSRLGMKGTTINEQQIEAMLTVVLSNPRFNLRSAVIA